MDILLLIFIRDSEEVKLSVVRLCAISENGKFDRKDRFTNLMILQIIKFLCLIYMNEELRWNLRADGILLFNTLFSNQSLVQGFRSKYSIISTLVVLVSIWVFTAQYLIH